jgi:AcrR family transcriptional regulator
MTKAEKTRQFIIDKTAPIFNTKGYAGTSLNDMIAATGLTKGSIYGNFANKDEVALAAFDCNLDKVNTILRAEMEKRKTYRDKLLVYPDVYDNFSHFSFPKGGCPVLNTATESDDTHPALRQRAQDAVLGWKKSIVNLIQKGMVAKEFKNVSDPEQFAITIIAMIEGASMLSNLTGRAGYRRSVMQTVREMIGRLS